MPTDATFLPGTEVEARGLRWEVVNATPMGEQTLLRLRGAGGAFGGSEVDLLSPFEQVTAVVHELDTARPTLLPNWLVYHQAFLLEQALGPDALLATTPGRLRIEPYQLVPVARCLKMMRPRLLLADDVGLGKTVEAGLILTELIARRMASRVLVVTPAGPLLDQWKGEMAERFGLRLAVADRAEIERIRRGTELGANPFDHLPLALASMDFLKQDRVLDWLERTRYDLVVLDEAHHYGDSASDEYDRSDASQRRKLALVLARAADALVLLSATPHDGHDRSFASLLELLDPSLTDSRGRAREPDYRDFVVRRLKSHVQVTHPQTGLPVGFPERQVVPVPVPVDDAAHAAFLAAQRELLGFVAPELKRAMRSRRYDDALAYLALLKRSVSTVHALHRTVGRVQARFAEVASEAAEEADQRRHRIRTLKGIQRRAARFGVLTPGEEAEREDVEVEDLAQQLAALQREARTHGRAADQAADLAEQLGRIVILAEKALSADPKLDALVSHVRAVRAEEPGANVLVYTEYADSMDVARRRLEQEGLGAVITLQGADDEPARKATTARFRSADGTILVATDAASEGLNLHQRCHHLIHLELCWSPTRLEQRNGRIDRYGQWHVPVVRYLYLQGTFEERILARLLAKYERQRAKLRFVPDTLGLARLEAPDDRVLEKLMGMDTTVDTQRRPAFDFVTEEDRADDPAVQALLTEIDDSLKRFDAVARQYAWLAGGGLHADELDRRDAERARRQGERAGAVDLVRFVQEAALLEGGDWQDAPCGFDLRVPPAWLHGLDELPGWDSQRQRLRLTGDASVLATPKGESLGYLGRTHPLVMRAIDRVRHLALGQAEGTDRRISVAFTDGPEPVLLLTFLGRVLSRAGRETERVLAARVGNGGEPAVLDSPAEWLPQKERAAPTRDAWQKHFAGWGDEARERTVRAAEAAWRKQGIAFATQHGRALDEEQTRLDGWLRERADEVCGVEVKPEPTLFDAVDPPAPSLTPAERLRQFFSGQPAGSKARVEVESVLNFHQTRSRRIAERRDLRPAELVPLGLLMLLPS